MTYIPSHLSVRDPSEMGDAQTSHPGSQPLTPTRSIRSHSRIGALLGIALPAFLGSASAFAAPNPSSKPNIVFILADDLGYGDIQALNPEGKIRTPQLDRLAAQGMTFTEAHSSSAVCTPSRYSILTGRYSWRSSLKSGVLGGFSPPLIEEKRLTVAEFLRQHGYHTAAFGKWHLGLDWPTKPGAGKRTVADENLGRAVDFSAPIGRAPTAFGFDEFFGISASLDMPPYTFIENNRVTVLPTEERALLWIETNPEGKKTRTGPAAPEFTSVDVLPALKKRAIDYVRGRAADARAGKPFFLYLPLNSPHTPIAPTPEWRGKSGLNSYADFVMETDAAVGDVLAAIDREGLADNTLVVFTSDNGCSPEADYPFLTSHQHDPSAKRRGYKADIYDGGHRIPLLVRWPSQVKAGSRSTAFVSLVDFLATSADVLGEKLPDNAAEDSISFLGLLRGNIPAGRRDTLVFHSIDGSFAIREERWKLELCPDSGGWSYPRPGRDKVEGLPKFQLFDLASDPAEKNNVVDQHPELVKKLGRKMRDILLSGRSTPGPQQPYVQPDNWKQTAWIENFR